MGLLDKLRGCREPAPGVAPWPAADVREALLAVGGEDAPWTITADGDDGVRAEWDLGGDGSRRRPHQVLRIFMRLHPDTHEVRTVDELASSGGGRAYKRGNIVLKGFSKTYMRGPEGYELAEESHSSTADLKDALRAAVTERGWRWSGRLLRRP